MNGVDKGAHLYMWSNSYPKSTKSAVLRTALISCIFVRKGQNIPTKTKHHLLTKSKWPNTQFFNFNS